MKLSNIIRYYILEQDKPEPEEDLTPIEIGPGQEPENTETEPKIEPEDSDTPELPPGQINKEQAVQLIKDTKGKFFTVTFTKKDGTERVMNARLGVKAYLKGGTLPYNPNDKGLIPVFDMKKGEYRMINANTISKLKIGNNEYNVQ
jgi:hypothetical protein